ncbi:hypothetical protein Tco_0888773 [Tanacetum coccineum]
MFCSHKPLVVSVYPIDRHFRVSLGPDSLWRRLTERIKPFTGIRQRRKANRAKLLWPFREVQLYRMLVREVLAYVPLLTLEKAAFKVSSLRYIRISRSGGRPPESKGELLRLSPRDTIRYLNRLKESESSKLPALPLLSSSRLKTSLSANSPKGTSRLANPSLRNESAGLLEREFHRLPSMKAFMSAFSPIASGRVFLVL